MQDLTEAYFSIYENHDDLNEVKGFGGHVDPQIRAILNHPNMQEDYVDEGRKLAHRFPRSPKEEKMARRIGLAANEMAKKQASESPTKSASKPKRKRKKLEFEVRENFYDLVLDHLLDEGYVDTEENAISMMSAMSEDWIDSIISEAPFQIRMTRYYHGTPESSADKIKKSGFNTSDVYTSTDRETAQSFGQRHGGKTKTLKFIVPTKDIDTPGKLMKTDGQRGVDKWGREHHSTVMNPDYAKKHLTKGGEGVIHSPKIPSEYRKQYFKNNPNSRFKRRTKTQPKRK